MPVQPVARRQIAVVLGVALAFGVVAAYLVPALSRTDSNRVFVVGNGLLDEAHDDVARRLRQRGYEVEIQLGAPSCEQASAARNVVVVASFSDPAASGDCADVLVRQDEMVLLGNAATNRLACEWWDTPGGGEGRPGLGQCQPDGSVVVRSGGRLTAAGSERFARAIVAALE